MAGLASAAYPAAAKVRAANGRIVFATFLPGKSTGDTLLFTANPDGSAKKLLLPTPSCCPSWSPDGRKIAVAYSAPDKRLTTALVNPDGSNLRVQPIPDPTLNLGCGVWSPDGSRMLCSGWDDNHKNRPGGLFTVRASDWGDLKQLTTNPNGMHDDPDDYSPDGKQILFIRERGQNDDALYTVPATGGRPRPIPTGSLVPDCCGASWSPDGKWILFSTRLTIEAVHPNGTGLHTITLKAHCTQPSGLAVLADIKVYGLHCHNSRFHLDPNHYYWDAFQPSWSPDGKKILFSLFIQTSATAGERGVDTANANGTNVAPLITAVNVQAQTLDFPASTDWGPRKP